MRIDSSIMKGFIVLLWLPYLTIILFLYILGRILIRIMKTTGILGFPELFNSLIWVNKSLEKLVKEILVSYNIIKEDDSMARITGIRSDQILEFFPKGQDDVPAEERTSFLVRLLDVSDSAAISDQVYSAKGFGNKREELLLAGTQELKILRKSLRGWKNFKFEDGVEIEWETPSANVSVNKFNEIMDRNLNRIPPDVRAEIADYVRGGSSPSKD
jgi:hypothetical protein